MIRRLQWTIGGALVAGGLAFAATVLGSGAAHAQDAAGAANADAEFRAGNQLRATDMGAACQHYARSMELDPNPTVLVRIGECHEHEGKLRQGLADYRRAQVLNQELNQSRVQQRASLGKEIERRLAELDARTPKLRVSVTPRPEGLEVVLDGELLDPTALDAPVPVDRASMHELVVRAPGYQEGSISGSGDLSITLAPAPEEATPALIAMPALPLPVPPPEAPVAHRASPPSPPARANHPDNGLREVGYVMGAIGLGALGAAGYFGLRTLSLVGDARPHCPAGSCDDQGYQQMVQATHAQTTGFILAGAGAALLGCGVVLVLTAPQGHSAVTSRSAAETVATVGPLGVSVRRLW